MQKFVFVLTRGLEDPTRATRCLQLAKAAKEQGHDVSMFLTDDAVPLAKKGMIDNVVAPTGDEASGHLFYLIDNDVPIYLWIPCAEARQVGEADVYDKIQFAGAPKLFELCEGATAMTF